MGPRFGSVPLQHPDGEIIEGETVIEKTPPPPAKPNPNNQHARAAQRRHRSNEIQRVSGQRISGQRTTDYWESLRNDDRGSGQRE
jgi:hypothetical protein